MIDTEQFTRAKEILQHWIDQQEHDRCWYYPDVFRELVALFGLTATHEPQLPPRDEFEQGCKRYQDEEYAHRAS